MLRFLDEVRDPIVLVHVDDPVPLGELRIADVEHGHAAAALRAPVRLVVGERVVEQVVSRDDEQIVVETHEVDVADRSEAIVVRGRAVVVDHHVLVLGPPLEVRRKPRVRDEVDLVCARLLDSVEDPIHHRPAADGQELLRNRVRERPETRGVAGGEDQGLHTSAASDSA